MNKKSVYTTDCNQTPIKTALEVEITIFNYEIYLMSTCRFLD